jgi:flagellar biosynthesis GTPase FlhF
MNVINTRSGATGTAVVKEDGTYTITFADGTVKDITAKTFKNWYKPVAADVEMKMDVTGNVTVSEVAAGTEQDQAPSEQDIADANAKMDALLEEQEAAKAAEEAAAEEQAAAAKAAAKAEKDAAKAKQKAENQAKKEAQKAAILAKKEEANARKQAEAAANKAKQEAARAAKPAATGTVQQQLVDRARKVSDVEVDALLAKAHEILAMAVIDMHLVKGSMTDTSTGKGVKVSMELAVRNNGENDDMHFVRITEYNGRTTDARVFGFNNPDPESDDQSTKLVYKSAKCSLKDCFIFLGYNEEQIKAMIKAAGFYKQVAKKGFEQE